VYGSRTERLAGDLAHRIVNLLGVCGAMILTGCHTVSMQFGRCGSVDDGRVPELR
jgi:hypothetical protein